MLPLVLIMMAVLVWFIDVPPLKNLNIPTEVNPSYAASWGILTNTLKNHLVFGSGLETYPYVYAQFKSAALNQTNFWGVNFNNSMAEVITWATTAGLFGAAAWLLFAAGFLIYAFKGMRINADQNPEADAP